MTSLVQNVLLKLNSIRKGGESESSLSNSLNNDTNKVSVTSNNVQTTYRVDGICKGLKDNIFNYQYIDPILEKFVLNDKDASINTYGQTGSGKSYTIAKCMPSIIDRIIELH